MLSENIVSIFLQQLKTTATNTQLGLTEYLTNQSFLNVLITQTLQCKCYIPPSL
jgi:hypothetical protein